MLIKDIQTYLHEHYSIDESLQRIKDAEMINYELENKESE